mmetsp:Transcript_13299/g.26196  ORF Transcript_13299/g.26196 Transcript_13299/m.26196 type:complete len:256 (-) Transcript_13299:382-1149(-)
MYKHEAAPSLKGRLPKPPLAAAPAHQPTGLVAPEAVQKQKQLQAAPASIHGEKRIAASLQSVEDESSQLRGPLLLPLHQQRGTAAPVGGVRNEQRRPRGHLGQGRFLQVLLVSQIGVARVQNLVCLPPDPPHGATHNPPRVDGRDAHVVPKDFQLLVVLQRFYPVHPPLSSVVFVGFVGHFRESCIHVIQRKRRKPTAVVTACGNTITAVIVFTTCAHASAIACLRRWLTLVCFVQHLEAYGACGEGAVDGDFDP